jgi:hypothetical protein
MLYLKERKGIAWLLSGAWKLGGIRSNIKKRIGFKERLCLTYSAGLSEKKEHL